MQNMLEMLLEVLLWIHHSTFFGEIRCLHCHTFCTVGWLCTALPYCGGSWCGSRWWCYLSRIQRWVGWIPVHELWMSCLWMWVSGFGKIAPPEILFLRKYFSEIPWPGWYDVCARDRGNEKWYKRSILVKKGFFSRQKSQTQLLLIKYTNNFAPNIKISITTKLHSC